MAVRVRLFAAVREAAGVAETTVEPGPLPGLLAELERRYGDGFAARLRACSVLVDGDSVGRGAAVDVRDGAEVAILPPVSGGARGLPWPGPSATAAGLP